MIVAAVAAVLASLLTYLFSIRITRKEKIHDAKLSTYGDVIGLLQESLMNLDNLIVISDVDASDEESFLPNFLNLMAELSGLGDLETLSIIADPKRLEKSIKEKGTRLYIESLASRVALLNTVSMANHFKQARMKTAQMLLVNPPESVREPLRKVQSAIVEGASILLKAAFEKYKDAFEGFELPKQPRTAAEWRKDTEGLVNDLLKSMQIDLITTL